MNRRHLLQNSLTATIAAALGSRSNALSPAGAHAATMAPRAKRIIYLFLSGGPSQQDLYDYKPLLNKHHKEQLFTVGNRKGLIEPKFRLTGMTATAAHPVCGTKYQFKQHGQGGAWLSELLPNIAKVTDDICFITPSTSITTPPSPPSRPDRKLQVVRPLARGFPIRWRR